MPDSVTHDPGPDALFGTTANPVTAGVLGTNTDGGTNTNITIAAPVSPASVHFNNSAVNYTLSGAAINHDLDLRLQYLAGMALLNDDAAAIYSEILARRTFPEDLFMASELYRDAIRQWMQETGPVGSAD